MAWTLTTSLAALRRDLNAAFPNRDRVSDGTIGDAAHQASTSGHNPDDTPGSRAEYSDADSKAEVRALDVDADLRTPDFTMQTVVDRILATPGDVKRLKYIIFNRRIWSRNTSWQPRAYTGASPHTEHAHFSGDPAFDEDASPWSVATFQQGAARMATQPEQAALNADNALYHALRGDNPIVGNKSVQSGGPVEFPNILAELKLKLDQLLQQPAGGQVTPSPEQWAALTADVRGLLESLFATKVGEAAEIAAEAAVRRVLGSLDGAVPPAPSS